MDFLIHIDDLITGLDEWNGSFEALDVFADDVSEFHRPQPLQGLDELGGNPPRFAVTRNGGTYHLVLFEREGLLRIEKAKADFARSAARVEPAGGAGAAISAAMKAATEKKGAAAQLNLRLGLMVGPPVEGEGAAERRQLFTMRFHPRERRWGIYNESLMEWMWREMLVGT